MPEKITDTLLVVENFKSDGVEYLAGDRVPTRHRAIRRIAASSPQFFAMEYGTEPLDLEWLASIEAEAEGRYEAVKRLKEAEKERGERALRQELKEQANLNSSAASRSRRGRASGASSKYARSVSARSSNGRSHSQVICDLDSTSKQGEIQGNERGKEARSEGGDRRGGRRTAPGVSEEDRPGSAHGEARRDRPARGSSPRRG